MANTFSFSRRSFMGICGALAARGAWSATPDSDGAGRTFRAGIALRDVTPSLGVSLAGHMQDRKATSIHDPLYVRCLALDNGETRLALAMADNCLIPRELLDAAKLRIHEAIGMDVSHILVAATHTHTAPCVTPVFQSDPDSAYMELLETQIVEGIVEAFARLEPARIAWGAGALPDEVFNRRWFMKPGTIPPNPFGDTTEQVRMNPPRASEDLIEAAGPTDPQIPIMALQRPDGSPLAVLANYALHYVGGVEGGAVSADYFGCFAEALGKLLTDGAGDEGHFVAMLSNGASGDVNNINFRETGEAYAPYEKMRAVADKVADEVHRVYQTLEFHQWASLGAATEEVALGVRRPNEDDLQRAREIVEAAESAEMKSMPEIYARESLLLAEYPEKKTLLLQALRIGDAAITAIPCEVFSEIGLELKKDSPFAYTVPIALANGYNGYLPTAAHHALGGYETWRARSSYLEVNASERIVAAMRACLARLDA